MPRARWDRWAQVAIIAGVLAWCGSAYRPGLGLTRLIGFSADWHARERPAVRAVPHDEAGPSYDGRFYAQMATEPALRDPAFDTALDTPIFRAHRIALPWMAWALGGGFPPAIVHVYAVLNIAAWLLLAWLLRRWLPADSWRGLVLWAGCLLGFGALASVRFSLTDLPATLLVGSAIAAQESGRRPLAVFLCAVAGLTRETALVSVAMFGWPWPKRPARLVVHLAVAALPLMLWYAYLYATHPHWRVIAGAGNIGLPFVGLWWKVRQIAQAIAEHGLDFTTIATVAGVVGFLTQGFVVVRRLAAPVPSSAWAAVGTTFFVLTLCVQIAPWDETPGAYLRIALPLAIAANVTMGQTSRPTWPLILLANATVVPSALLRW